MANDVGPSQSSKLQEQATSKADLSYSYWAANQANLAQSKIVQPKKLSEAEVAAQQQMEHSQSIKGASSWNHADTFEERDVTAFAKQQLAELLVGAEATAAGVQLRATGLQKCEGEAHVWLIRGKKRAGFEFGECIIEFEARSEDGGSGGSSDASSGTFRLLNVAADDLDELGVPAADVKVTSGDVQQAVAAAAARQLLGELQRRLEGLADVLKSK